MNNIPPDNIPPDKGGTLVDPTSLTTATQACLSALNAIYDKEIEDNSQVNTEYGRNQTETNTGNTPNHLKRSLDTQNAEEVRIKQSNIGFIPQMPYVLQPPVLQQCPVSTSFIPTSSVSQQNFIPTSSFMVPQVPEPMQVPVTSSTYAIQTTYATVPNTIPTTTFANVQVPTSVSQAVIMPRPTPTQITGLKPGPVPLPNPGLNPGPIPTDPNPAPSPVQNSQNPNTKSLYEKNKMNRYSSTDIGPFFIIVESNNPNKKIGRLHKIALGKMIFNILKSDSKDIENIDKLDYNRIRVESKSFVTANKILDSQALISDDIVAYIPESKMFRKGVVRFVDTSVKVSEIMEMAVSEREIVDIQRMTRRVTTDLGTHFEETQTIVISFRGQTLPSSISIYGARCKVEPYVYKVTQCLQCLRFGHIARYCKSQIRCNKCGEDHSDENCTIIDPARFNCVSCHGQHKSTDKMCPEYKKQSEIKKFMAHNNVGYNEAKNKYRSYSNVASTPYNSDVSEYPSLTTNNRFTILNQVTEKEDEIFNQRLSIPTVYSRRESHVRALQRNGPQSSYTTPEINYSVQRPSNPTKSMGAIPRNPYRPQYHLPNTENAQTSHPSIDCINYICEKMIEIVNQAMHGSHINPSAIREILVSSLRS